MFEGVGSTVGGAIGSVIPGVGTVAGGVVGGILGGLFGGGRSAAQISADEQKSLAEWLNNAKGDGYNIPDTVMEAILRPVWNSGGNWQALKDKWVSVRDSGQVEQYKIGNQVSDPVLIVGGTQSNSNRGIPNIMQAPAWNVGGGSNASLGGFNPLLMVGLAAGAYFMFKK